MHLDSYLPPGIQIGDSNKQIYDASTTLVTVDPHLQRSQT